MWCVDKNKVSYADEEGKQKSDWNNIWTFWQTHSIKWGGGEFLVMDIEFLADGELSLIIKDEIEE